MTNLSYSQVIKISHEREIFSRFNTLINNLKKCDDKNLIKSLIKKFEKELQDELFTTNDANETVLDVLQDAEIKLIAAKDEKIKSPKKQSKVISKYDENLEKLSEIIKKILSDNKDLENSTNENYIDIFKQNNNLEFSRKSEIFSYVRNCLLILIPDSFYYDEDSDYRSDDNTLFFYKKDPKFDKYLKLLKKEFDLEFEITPFIKLPSQYKKNNDNSLVNQLYNKIIN